MGNISEISFLPASVKAMMLALPSFGSFDFEIYPSFSRFLMTTVIFPLVERVLSMISQMR